MSEIKITQLQKFINLYLEFGINLSPILVHLDARGNPVKQTLEIKVGREKVSGYLGFQTELSFDMEGNFLEQKIWE